MLTRFPLLRNRFFSTLAKATPIENIAKYPVVALCTAEEYNLKAIKDRYSSSSFVTPDSLSVTFPSGLVKKECFFFTKGTLIGWNLTEQELLGVTKDIEPFQINPLAQNQIERESFDYAEMKESKQSEMLTSSLMPNSNLICIRSSYSESDAALDKLAFSHGIVNSVKLAVLEEQLEAFLMSIKSIPNLLIAGKRLAFSRKQVLQKLGELLTVRSQLNLHSGLLEVPDMFWNDEVREVHYKNTCDALDIKKRVSILNKKLDYANEIATLLKEHLSERHSLMLEWCIIMLILIEVLFQFWEQLH